MQTIIERYQVPTNEVLHLQNFWVNTLSNGKGNILQNISDANKAVEEFCKTFYNERPCATSKRPGSARIGPLPNW